MQQVNAYWLYELGELLGRVRGVLIGEPDEDIVGLVSITIYSLRYFADDQWVPLRITKEDFTHLAEALHKTITEKPPGIVLTSATKRALGHQLDAVRQVLSRELPHTPMYYVPPRFGYVAPTLLENAGQIFGTGEADVMAIAGPDISEAGRCLAFGLWTAFGFHFLRACELVILEYLKACGREVRRGSWQNYLAALGQVPGVSRQMKRALDRLTRWDRDELMHPARTLTEPEAESLLDDIKAAMRDMVTDIRMRRAAAPPGQE